MFSFDLSLYIFIFCLFLHLKLKWVFLNFSYVMLYQNGLVNTGLKLFLFTVRVTFKTMQWVFFFYKIWHFISSVKNVGLISIYVTLF